jgi:molecular chaperone IbpA
MTRLTTLDLTPFHRSFVGFDRLFEDMDRMFENSVQTNGGYPPYNIVKESDKEEYTISLAVAGFGKDDLEITVHDGELAIEGKISDKVEEDVNYLHKGIGTRQFKRTFRLADYMEVKDSSFKDGILNVSLVRNVPEEKQPKKIAIKG